MLVERTVMLALKTQHRTKTTQRNACFTAEAQIALYVWALRCLLNWCATIKVVGTFCCFLGISSYYRFRVFQFKWWTVNDCYFYSSYVLRFKQFTNLAMTCTTIIESYTFEIVIFQMRLTTHGNCDEITNRRWNIFLSFFFPSLFECKHHIERKIRCVRASPKRNFSFDFNSNETNWHFCIVNSHTITFNIIWM